MYFFFFFNDTATTEIYTLSLHDALPIWLGHGGDSLDVVGRQQACSSTCTSRASSVCGTSCCGSGCCALHHRPWPGMSAAPSACQLPCSTMHRPASARPASRSEERRVGKECRSRWSP